MAEEKPKPTNKWRLGTVCVTEWSNKSKNKDDEEIEYKSYSVDASYFDKESKEYKEAKSLSVGQLSRLQVCIGEALKSDVKNK